MSSPKRALLLGCAALALFMVAVASQPAFADSPDPEATTQHGVVCLFLGYEYRNLRGSGCFQVGEVWGCCGFENGEANPDECEIEVDYTMFCNFHWI